VSEPRTPLREQRPRRLPPQPDRILASASALVGAGLVVVAEHLGASALGAVIVVGCSAVIAVAAR
jgi:hypothetical protein